MSSQRREGICAIVSRLRPRAATIRETQATAPTASLRRRRRSRQRVSSPQYEVGMGLHMGPSTFRWTGTGSHRGLVSNQRNNDQSRNHPGRSYCPALGGSSVRTTGGSPPLPGNGMQGSLADTEPEARTLPLPSWEARNEAMGLPSNQVADTGATQDRGGATPQGGSGVALVGMELYHDRGRSPRTSPRGQRVQRLVHRAVGHDGSLGRVRFARKRLGTHASVGGVRDRGEGRRSAQLRRLVDASAVAKYISALCGLLQMN